MDLEKSKVITLSNYFDSEELENIYGGFRNFKPNGKAILIGEGSDIDLYKDLFAYLNSNIYQHAKSLKVSISPEINIADNNTDNRTRDFLIKYTAFNESLLNSQSMRNTPIKIEEYDRDELKQKLLMLAEML